MKTYNYFYYGRPISKDNFLKEVPEDWEEKVNALGHFSFGGYDAFEREN